MSRHLAVGDLIRLDEADYCYGIGPLRLRVTEVLAGVMHRNEAWIEVRGVPVLWNGADGDERFATVRLSALAKGGRNAHRG